VGAGPVDLGGGALAQSGTQDFVIGSFDAAAAHLWSRRFGAPGVTLSTPSVVVSDTGNVVLSIVSSGTVQLGGASLGASSQDTLAASFSPAGAHRWSRVFHVNSSTSSFGSPTGIDGCGAFVVVTTDPSFNPGCGEVIPAPGSAFYPPNVAIARFAP